MNYRIVDGSPIALKCLICHEDLSENAEKLYCDDHYPEYQTRKHEGVLTDKLDPRWGDTLNIWQSRPAELEKEPDAQLFGFKQKKNDWLLFKRGYQWRLPDWITINISTHEIRRFLQVSKTDVLEDLLNIRPAPFQEEIDKYWGTVSGRKTITQFDSHYNEKGQLNLQKLIEAASMAVYGLANNHYDLKLSSVYWSASNRGPETITLIFKGLLPNGNSDFFQITSTNPKAHRNIQLKPGIQGVQFVEDTQWFMQYGINSEQIEKLGSPQLFDENCIIADNNFSGKIRYWQWSNPLTTFILEYKDIVLHGSSSGIQIQELYKLLSQLVVINEQTNLLAQFQDELEQNNLN